MNEHAKYGYWVTHPVHNPKGAHNTIPLTTADKRDGWVEVVLTEQKPDNRVPEAWTNLLAYVLQDDMCNRTTPRITDIAYNAFLLAKRPNNEDGGASDWFNDTKPAINEMIAKLRKDLIEELAGAPQADSQPASSDYEVTLHPPMPTTGFRVGMPTGVKVLHKPTGLFAVSESERSQHRNREVAMQKLEALLAAVPAPADSIATVIECGNLYAKVKLSGEAFGTTKVGDKFYAASAVPQPAVADVHTLLQEVAACFTRDDDLPDNLLPRIDAVLKARKQGGA